MAETITTMELAEKLLLEGRRINKFTFLTETSQQLGIASVCLAQRILDIKQQKGWNIRSSQVKGKGTLKEYWLDEDEIDRILGRKTKHEQGNLGLFGEPTWW